MGRSRDLARLYNRLTDNPLFTLLFLQETIKQFVVDGYELTPLVAQFGVLTIVSTVLWILSDADVDWYDTIVGTEEEDG